MMKRKLMRLRDEAAQHREKYETHKDSSDDWLRRKVAVDLDRWLMEHREVAIILVSEALDREVRKMSKLQDDLKTAPRQPWWRKITTKTARP